MLILPEFFDEADPHFDKLSAGMNKMNHRSTPQYSVVCEQLPVRNSR